jgi:hypothetical protein
VARSPEDILGRAETSRILQLIPVRMQAPANPQRCPAQRLAAVRSTDMTHSMNARNTWPCASENAAFNS